MLRTCFATLLLGAVATLMVSSLPAPANEEPLSPSEECKANMKRCVLYPKDCDLSVSGSCSIVFAAHEEGDAFIFNMWTNYSNYTAYVAVAFGETEMMGSDSVIECVKEGDLVKAYMSFNSGKTEKKHGGNKRLPPEEQKGIKLLSSNTANGGLSCSVQRDQKTTVQKKEYDLATGSWYLQIAAGNRLKEGEIAGIAHHDRWVVSKKVMITKDGLTPKDTDTTNGPNSATTSGVNVVLLLALIGVSGIMYS